ncbi:MAG: HAD-IIIC family phosphatase [Candidatus Omnitrophota bacterium]|nr:MAG: HAD-IIIC family phosphatase [Candidatus Omnitrophota bacterium]
MFDEDIKYTDILDANRRLGKCLSGAQYNIAVLSNIVTYKFNDIFEYFLRKENINAHVKSGNYDNIVQDSQALEDVNLVIVFWEAANFVEGLHYMVNVMDQEQTEELEGKIKTDISFVLENLKKVPLVIFNRFSPLLFNYQNIRQNKFDRLCENLNRYLEAAALENVKLVDINKVITQVSVKKSIDERFYYSSKALYSVEFYKCYTAYIRRAILSVHGKSKKVFVFDCDDTLWKGIVAEDGFDGIEMSRKTKDGAIFEEIQYQVLKLCKQGVILGLCSKNNPSDIDEVFARHPDMVLRKEHITIKKVNWNDKVSNLKEIANELNVAFDSLVFIDDSDFDLNFVKAQLPQVTVLKVPEKLYEYPSMLRKCAELFFALSESDEDIRRTALYRQQQEREHAKSKYSNLEEYLESLKLRLIIHVDARTIVPRIAQMTQKTNQFNLTTKRYTESEINKFVENDGYKIFAFDAHDKFGCYGITGLCIVHFENNKKKCYIDSFLMSCRVIGRNLEFSFFDFIVSTLKAAGVEEIEGRYVKTIKNSQVSDFYDKVGFQVVRSSEKEKVYRLEISRYRGKKVTYVQTEYGKGN